MHIGIIGKVPPLQGGTATQTLWMAYQLALRHHRVSIVTTNEAEARNFQCLASDASWERLRTRYTAFARVAISPLPVEEPRSVFAIPASQAEATRLAHELLSIAERDPLDAVLGVYLEPYGVAAGLAARALSAPLALMHAGSDVARLAQAPTRALAYRAVLQQADLILTTPTSARAVLELGVPGDRLIVGRPDFDPPDLFTAANPLSVNDLVAECTARGWRYHLPAGWPGGKFTVLSYGKIGQQKGTRLLLEAVARASKQVPISLLMAVPQGKAFDSVLQLADNLGIAEQAAIVPFVAPWDVPGLLALADAATFLENDFQVAIHRPRVAREIALSGTPLILTREVADYQRVDLRSGENCFLVDAPYSPDQLTQHLVTLAQDPGKARAMGAAGRSAFAELKTMDPINWIDEFVRALGTGANQMALQDMQDALVNLYVNPAYRHLASDDVAKRHDLDAKERSIVAGVLADQNALQRYRSSLIEKKWGFLWRQSRANVAIDLSRYEDEVHRSFAESWPFLDRSLGRELQDFVDLIAEVAGPQGDAREVSEALALGRLRLGVLFQAASVEAGLFSYSEAIPDDPTGYNLRVAPWTMVEKITVGNEDSYYVGTPSRTSFAADLFRISQTVYSFLLNTNSFDSFEKLVHGLAEAAAVIPSESEAVIRQMIARGVFQFQF